MGRNHSEETVDGLVIPLAARDVRACGAGEPWGSGSVAREGGLLRLRGGKHGGVKAKELWEKVTPRRVPCFLSARAWG